MRSVTRRRALELIVAAGAVASASCSRRTTDAAPERRPPTPAGPDPVLDVAPLAQQWQTRDPFLFCVHHDDRYPAGNERFGPAVSLEGRRMGSDFAGKDGWRMYHGRVVPGFPQHPHRGFETVTVVRRGLLDHSDSMGAAARYGGGDVQWLTAGGGIQHAEMFPLLDSAGPNPVELFQIWLNLPRANKMVKPHFSMLWKETIPSWQTPDDRGRVTRVTAVAGAHGPVAVPSPPPSSWAANPENDLAIWTIAMEAGATWKLPPTSAGTNRTLYFFRGAGLSIAGREIPAGRAIQLRPELEVELASKTGEIEILMLQGRPIGEPIARHGPFVMNTDEEIGVAYADYQRTQFGGWPWPASDPVHGAEPERFARHATGRVERPT